MYCRKPVLVMMVVMVEMMVVMGRTPSRCLGMHRHLCGSPCHLLRSRSKPTSPQSELMALAQCQCNCWTQQCGTLAHAQCQCNCWTMSKSISPQSELPALAQRRQCWSPATRQWSLATLPSELLALAQRPGRPVTRSVVALVVPSMQNDTDDNTM